MKEGFPWKREHAKIYIPEKIEACYKNKYNLYISNKAYNHFLK